ncbi:hypothetical protein KDA_45840 [Dictyobacter alpinus]|uniref:HTH tetR-type domain-containing protein n=1 Tax=Dictyobacter alpinus TaxID=2014873 RepID=A0A402BCR1_9CHLR|nr:TetR/AcrR family transcriptional regulator [Dictyobacter alpinus]GCE29100.1 hypothetical protein KDA_45840 [Dictyobacter alpinus]
MNRKHDGRNTNTQERILAVAENLYLAGGYEHINLQSIAHALEISKPALFYHFKSKRELFFVMLIRMLESLQQALEEAVDQDQFSTQEKLERLMEAIQRQPAFDVTRFAQEEMHLLTPSEQQEVMQAAELSLFAPVERVFREGIERGTLRTHDTRLACLLFLNICVPLSHERSPLQLQVQTGKRREMLEMFLYGLASAPRPL